MIVAVPRPSMPAQGWALIGALSASFFVVVGVCAVAVGLLLTPLMNEFRWQNSTISGLATMFSLATLLASPLAGLFIDRFGERPALAGGVAATGAGFLGVGCSHSLAAFYAAFLVIGVGYGAAFFLAATTLVAKRMGRQQNFAMGVVFGAGAVGAAFFAMAMSWSIARFGWRLTSDATAALMLATIPLVLCVIPERDGAREPAQDMAAAPVPRTAPLKLVLAPFFLVTTAATAFAAFGMGGVNFHIVPILLKAGYAPGLASAAFGSSWLLSGIGSFGAGMVGARFGARNMLAASLLFGGLGTLLLIFIDSPRFGGVWLWLFVLLWGLTANALNQFVPLILIEKFGPDHLAALVGIQSALMGLVGSFAPLATGALYDLFSDYRAAILTSTITTLIGFMLIAGSNNVWRPAPRTPAGQGIHL